MIRWCSYCQTYLGLKEPFEVYDFTHGVCEHCMAKVLVGSPMADRSEELRVFYAKYIEQAAQGKLFDMAEFTRHAESLGIDFLSLFMGILQPMLYEIGDRYAQGCVSISKEHRFTAFVETILERFRRETNVQGRPEVILTCVEGNHHTLGIRILGEALIRAGVACMTWYPGMPDGELLELIDTNRPQVIGISVSEEHHLKKVEGTVSKIRDAFGSEVAIALGGYSTLNLVDSQADFVFGPRTVREFLSFLSTLSARRTA